MADGEASLISMAVRYEAAKRESAFLATPEGLRWAVGTDDAVSIPWESIQSASLAEAETRRSSEGRAVAMGAFALILSPLALLAAPFIRKTVTVERLAVVADGQIHTFECVNVKGKSKPFSVKLLPLLTDHGVSVDHPVNN